MIDVPRRCSGLFKTELTDLQQSNTELNINEYNANKSKLKSYPRRILLEITNMCNYRCIMCGRRFCNFAPSYLDTNLIKNISFLFKYAEEVTLFGWGEPTIHPEFSNIMEFLSSFHNLRKYILTNGSNLPYIKKLVQKGLIDILAISLDGATSEINNSIREGSDFDSIVRAIQDIVALKTDEYHLPFMNLVFVMMKKNIHQLPDMVKLTHELGIPELKAVYLTSFNKELNDETLWFNKEDEYEKYFDLARDIADDLGILLKLPAKIGEDVAKDASHKPCSDAWRDLFISSNGLVRPCQSTSFIIDDINDYKFEHEQDFFDLWNNKKFISFRKNVNCEECMDANCKYCYQSSHANWNKKYAHIREDIDVPDWK